MQPQPILSFRTALDSRNRITLRGKNLPEFFEAEVFANGEIHLKPKVLASPEEVISKETQKAIGNAVKNSRRNKIGPKFNAAKFSSLLDDEENEE